MRNKFEVLVQKIRYNFLVEFYNLLYLIRKKNHTIVPTVHSIEQTISQITTNHCSVSRFGDGEMLLIGRKSIRFQNESELLSQKLIEVLKSQEGNHLVCISDVFVDLERYNRRAKRFWRTHFYL